MTPEERIRVGSTNSSIMPWDVAVVIRPGVTAVLCDFVTKETAEEFAYTIRRAIVAAVEEDRQAR